MIEVYTLIAGIVLCVLGIMMLVWTKNFILMRFESFHKFIRKNEIEIKYRRLAVFNAILYFVTAIPLLTTAIIGFVIEIPYMTYVWIFIAVAVFGLVGILYSNISNQFIQSLDLTNETD